MYAKITLIGNVGRDPEARKTQSGHEVATFSLAYNESKKDMGTGQDIKSTEWFDVVAFSKQAVFCQQYVKKGSKVYIEGQPTFDKWDKDGVPQKKMKIILREIRLLDKKETEERPQAGAPHPTRFTEDVTAPSWGSPEPPAPTGSEDLNDHIPF